MKIVAKGLNEVIAKFDKAAKFNNLDMRTISEMMLDDIHEHFKEERGPNGPWQPLKYRSGKILQDNRDLYRSILKSNTKLEAKVSTNSEYAGVHNYGDRNHLSWGKVKTYIPQREFMYLSPLTISEIKKRIASRVVK